MKRRLVLVLLFAIGISGVASLLLYRLLSGGSARASQKDAVNLFVAARPLKTGTVVKDGDLKLVRWAAGVPQEAIRNKEDILDRGVIENIFEGEPFLNPRLAPKGAGGGLAATIPPGKRAVAIRVNDVVSVAGFVLPGMRVDVLMSANAPGENREGKITKTILQNVEVLSAGKQIDKDAEGKPVNVPVINLLVSPEEAEVLSLASNEAKIQLVLRNPLDMDAVQTPGVGIGKLLGLPDTPVRPQQDGQAPGAPAPRATAPKPPPPPPPEYTIEVIHGAKRAETQFAEVKGGTP